ncbi:tRNA (guanine-N(1)-)-methyltransferase [Striga asiatica]|uniref:tRNA (Guanine-N(1)-)-methyltransferase n=1 Tax=Striga asiatica TaxID=4170 RepID=A0A5A7NZG0_STRAF|nr:tRNA (guanine-N(1)-)-methyltransferase [Striga asiatica]
MADSIDPKVEPQSDSIHKIRSRADRGLYKDFVSDNTMIATISLQSNIYNKKQARDIIKRSTEVNGYLRDINVIILIILTRHHHIKVVAARWQIHLCHIPCQLSNLPVHAFLVPREHAVVQQTAPKRDTVRIQALVGKPPEKLPESGVTFDDPPVPHSPAHVPVLHDLGRHRLGH